MKSVQDQFAEVLSTYSGASMSTAPDGTLLVIVPGVIVPPGWSRQSTEVRFTIPAGYPYAVPDCFWTDGDLRLATGQIPQNAQPGQVTPAQSDPSLLWFSWHITANTWNPAASDLMTYVKVIRNRFEVAQ